VKLLYITNSSTGPGGLESVLSVKASLLAEDIGYEVHILSLNEKGKDTFFEFSSKIIRHDLEVSSNAYVSLNAYLRGMRRTVEQVQPDLPFTQGLVLRTLNCITL